MCTIFCLYFVCFVDVIVMFLYDWCEPPRIVQFGSIHVQIITTTTTRTTLVTSRKFEPIKLKKQSMQFCLLQFLLILVLSVGLLLLYLLCVVNNQNRLRWLWSERPKQPRSSNGNLLPYCSFIGCLSPYGLWVLNNNSQIKLLKTISSSNDNCQVLLINENIKGSHL